MNRLEYLRALLDEALDGDPKAESEFLGRYGERLLDVAEAARLLSAEVHSSAEAFRSEHSPSLNYLDDLADGLDVALAPLTEEADHDEA